MNMKSPYRWIAEGTHYRAHPRTWATGRPYHLGKPDNDLSLAIRLVVQHVAAIGRSIGLALTAFASTYSEAMQHELEQTRRTELMVARVKRPMAQGLPRTRDRP